MRSVRFLYCLRNSNNCIVNVCFENASGNALSFIGEKLVYLRDKLNVNFREVNLQTTIKKINKSFKDSQRILTHINNLKTVLSIRSGDHGIEYLNREEINYMIHYICTE